MKELVDGVLPRVLPAGQELTVLVHEGRTDLERSIPRKLRAWHGPASFVVLRDQDGAECHAVKAKLVSLCAGAGRAECLVRVVCNHLESWILGDLQAVEVAFGVDGLARLQKKRKFRNPDRMTNAAQELRKLVPGYRKIAGARAVAPHLDPSRNRSHSFRVFVDGVRRVVGAEGVNGTGE